MGLIETLGGGPVAIDTVVLIYWTEEHPIFAPILQPVFEAIDAGRCEAIASSLSLLEVLVMPYRAGNLQLAESYEALLSRSRGLRLVEADRPVLRTAAGLRARFPSLRTPDALQLASALAGKCACFLTSDRDLPALPGLSVVTLGAFVPGGRTAPARRRKRS